MRTTIRSITSSCKTFQTNKRRKLKYGYLPSKTVICNPWECLCVNLIGPYTLKGKDNLQIDFVALTMINPTHSWFEIVELPIITQLQRQTVNCKELLKVDKIFDKSSDCIAKLLNKTWLCRYPQCHYLTYNNRSEFKLHFKYLCKSYGIKRKPTTVKNPQANAIMECMHQVLIQILPTAEIDMATSVTSNDINVFGDLLYLSYSTEQLNRYKGSGGNEKTGGCTFWVGTYPWREQFSRVLSVSACIGTVSNIHQLWEVVLCQVTLFY
jgi:hypothetical protein